LHNEGFKKEEITGSFLPPSQTHITSATPCSHTLSVCTGVISLGQDQWLGLVNRVVDLYFLDKLRNYNFSRRTVLHGHSFFSSKHEKNRKTKRGSIYTSLVNQEMDGNKYITRKSYFNIILQNNIKHDSNM